MSPDMSHDVAPEMAALQECVRCRKMSTNVDGFGVVVSGACAARAKARMPAAAVDILHLC